MAGDSAPAERELLHAVTAEPPNLEPDAAALDSFLTPADVRFVRCHFEVPSIDLQGFALEVAGAVARPLRLTLEDLRALPQRSVTAVTECAGNSRASLSPPPRGEPWAGGAVANAQWTGVPLTAVIDRCGLREEALELLFTGEDHGLLPGGERASYARALPRSKAVEEDVLLALEMNGADLLPAHGAPLRLVVPGWYGMAHVKWLRRIEAVAQPFTGWFQAERFLFIEYGAVAKVSRMRVKSLVTSPAAFAVLAPGPQRIRGFAWSGEGAIDKVEVAFEGGDEWREATLLEPQLPHAWRAWQIDWEPPAAGRYLLRSRATDARGNRQPAAPHWNEQGYGANAVQPVLVEVR
ncbi:MAG TPA: sulfite oxidase [Myxococcales bacterium]|nr:sulfite oxidase [Myxococcales bacterium]